MSPIPEKYDHVIPMKESYRTLDLHCCGDPSHLIEREGEEKETRVERHGESFLILWEFERD